MPYLTTKTKISFVVLVGKSMISVVILSKL